MRKMPTFASLLAASCVISLALGAHRAAAEGALAIGISGDIATDGYSIGIATNHASDQAAKDGALQQCKSDGSDLTKSKCEIIVSFKNMCAAEAEDSLAGTPGAGWAVGANKTSAEKMAMTSCLATAGKARMQYCKVVSTLCDGTAQ